MDQGPKKRRTQAERSAETRKRLLEAALDCIAEYGYHHTTTSLIVQKAGVSRGAQVHHFPTKLDLVAAAVEYLYVREVAEALNWAADHPGDDPDIGLLFESIWQNAFHGRLWEVTLEMVVAARTDPELRSRIAPIYEEYRNRVDELTERKFSPKQGVDENVETLMNFGFSVMRGLAFQRIFKENPAYYERVLGLLKKIGEQHIDLKP